MLAVADLTVAIQHATVLRGVSLRIPPRQTAGLIGRNGAGKTTLMRGLCPWKAARSPSTDRT
jgi:ABC-type Mn2+/Zn2+ transport system ATPase subunit